MTLRLATVNDVREGDRVVDWDTPDRPARPIRRVDHAKCRNHVHLDSDCYDAGYPMYIWTLPAD